MQAEPQRRPSYLALAAWAAAAGALLWALSPLLLQRREPWVSQLPYYWIGLIALAVYLVPSYLAARIVYWWVGRDKPARL